MIRANLCDGKNNDGAGMPNDVAASANAARFFDVVCRDMEYRSAIRDAGRNDACFGGTCRFRHDHHSKVCCAHEGKTGQTKTGDDSGRSGELGWIPRAGVGESRVRDRGNRGAPAAGSLARAWKLARRVGARVVTTKDAIRGAAVLWFCVPDREIRRAAEVVATRVRLTGVRFAFHSSGALASGELDVLRRAGSAVASVHPLMTFVEGARLSLAGVPFAIEGDGAAMKMARRIVRDLGGESFGLASGRKAAYHAWATMTSPLLLAYLVTLEEAAREAGLSRDGARRMSLPIVRQTLANYARLGPGKSFSGPYVRGDAATVATHLALLKNAKTRAVYVALARIALDRLPVKNRRQLQRLLEES
jgi:predicted short-subunit dehydrogenase-like oxidoreductase (DUF2520 family)